MKFLSRMLRWQNRLALETLSGNLHVNYFGFIVGGVIFHTGKATDIDVPSSAAIKLRLASASKINNSSFERVCSFSLQFSASLTTASCFPSACCKIAVSIISDWHAPGTKNRELEIELVLIQPEESEIIYFHVFKFPTCTKYMQQ